MSFLTYTLCIIGAGTVATLTIMVLYELIKNLLERIFHNDHNSL